MRIVASIHPSFSKLTAFLPALKEGCYLIVEAIIHMCNEMILSDHKNSITATTMREKVISLQAEVLACKNEVLLQTIVNAFWSVCLGNRRKETNQRKTEMENATTEH